MAIHRFFMFCVTFALGVVLGACTPCIPVEQVYVIEIADLESNTSVADVRVTFTTQERANEEYGAPLDPNPPISDGSGQVAFTFTSSVMCDPPWPGGCPAISEIVDDFVCIGRTWGFTLRIADIEKEFLVTLEEGIRVEGDMLAIHVVSISEATVIPQPATGIVIGCIDNILDDESLDATRASE